jgi:hypothetical protein
VCLLDQVRLTVFHSAEAPMFHMQFCEIGVRAHPSGPWRENFVTGPQTRW